LYKFTTVKPYKKYFMEPKEVKREYATSDSTMTETARVIYDLFELDMAQFTLFDATLDAGFGSQYLLQLKAAEQVIDDVVVIDQIVNLTEQADENMDLARGKYNDVKYFVKKAFDKSVGIQGEFGLNDYDNVRQNRTEMTGFLFEIHATCIKYSTQLIAAGFSQTAIDDILPIRENLLVKNSQQELLKRQRPKLTEDRIIILNTCYQTMTQINAAAQRVYSNDFAKQKQYVFAPSSKKDEIFVFEGFVPAGLTLKLATVDYIDTSTVTFANTGTTSLSFSLSSTEELEGIVIELGKGAEFSDAMSKLLAGGTNIIVRNNDLITAGSYEVIVTE